MSDEFVDYIEIGEKSYKDVVPRYYEMNPYYDDLLWADELVDGMLVLHSNTGSRFDEDNPTLYGAGLLENNRWCTVNKLRTDEGLVHFVGVYSDGLMRIRRSQATTGWLVKKNSIPKREAEPEEFQDVPSPFIPRGL